MPVTELTSTVVKLIEVNPNRKFISFINEDDGNKAYISDVADPTQATAKWIICPLKKLIISRQIGFPERAFYGFATGGNVKLAIGFQNDDEEARK